MERAARIELEEDGGGRIARLTGDWTTASIGDQGDRLERLMAESPPPRLDLREIGKFDTAGALAVARQTFGPDQQWRTIEGLDGEAVLTRPETARLLDLINKALAQERPKPPRGQGLLDLVARIGEGLLTVGRDFLGQLAFFGALILAIGRTIANPRRIRWAPLVALCERAGLDAIPIVAVTSFFIGAVVGLLGANMLAQFGAQVFAVELIGIAVLREFNIIITAVLLAGRSASAFAAEIGSMKMNQEIDAMQVMGVDPFEALVLPRFGALLLMTPLLVFVATLAGLAGGILVSWSVLDLSPAFFIQRIVDNVGVVNFWVGLSKAPVMAAVIAAIGCRQGMEVGGDVESLGRRVTAAVVQAIFSIIVIDAVFALVYMELNV